MVSKQKLIKLATDKVESGQDGLGGPYIDYELNGSKLIDLVVEECVKAINNIQETEDNEKGLYYARNAIRKLFKD